MNSISVSPLSRHMTYLLVGVTNTGLSQEASFLFQMVRTLFKVRFSRNQAKVLTRYLIGHQTYRFFLLISWLYAPSPQASLGCICVSSVASVVSDTLQIPTDYSLLGSSVHGILQARILEWVAMPSSRGSSQPRVQTSNSCVSCTAGRFFTTEPPRKPQSSLTAPLKYCVYCFFCL